MINIYKCIVYMHVLVLLRRLRVQSFLDGTVDKNIQLKFKDWFEASNQNESIQTKIFTFVIQHFYLIFLPSYKKTFQAYLYKL